jgi:hypothetical protein
MEFSIVKTSAIQNQFRKAKNPVNTVSNAIRDLRDGESLIIPAKSTDKWKSPATALRGIIYQGYKRKQLPKSIRYSVKHLKSGSYAIVRNSN